MARTSRIAGNKGIFADNVLINIADLSDPDNVLINIADLSDPDNVLISIIL